MRYARVESGTVFEVVETDKDIATLYHPSLIWVECPVEVDQRWTYDGKDFSRPPPPPTPKSPPKVLTAESLAAALKAKGVLTDAEIEVVRK